MQPPRMLQWSVSPESSSHDQLESWGLEGRSMPQKLMAHVVARAQFALLKAHGGMAKAALTRDVAWSG
jgi:hypothetical protein